MKLELELSELKDMINTFQNPEQLFETLRVDVRKEVGTYLSSLLDVELTGFLGREPYERLNEPKNHRNGSYDRSLLLKGIGKVNLKIPRDRLNKYQSEVIPKAKRYEKAIEEDLSLMFLSGVSTRSLSLISKRLLGEHISHSQISKCSNQLKDSVEKWRSRDLSEEMIKYLYVDGTFFKMRTSDSIESIPLLVTIGVSEAGYRMVLSVQRGDKDSASGWREVFKDLKTRGLDHEMIQLGIMDGLPGLEKVFKEEFPYSKTQRCQVHVARNVLCKVPKKMKNEVADGMRNIFYAPTKKKAISYFDEFIKKYQNDMPSACRSLSNSIESCLTYLSFPQEEWISLRTTNPIERLNKEFKRRTRPMEIVAGESSCYALLTFISLKMECHWRYNPIGKMNVDNLSFFKQISNL